MNKYRKALKRLKGMIYTSPFSDEKRNEIDYNDLKKCDTQLQNDFLRDLCVMQELIVRYEALENAFDEACKMLAGIDEERLWDDDYYGYIKNAEELKEELLHRCI